MAAPGWYPVQGSTRYWDGTAWTPTLPRDARQDRLEAAIAENARYGGRLETHTPFQAVMVFGGEPNHVVHALLTIFSCGLWLPFWLLFTVLQKTKRLVISVDEYGTVHHS